jgi:hypothetical protein
MNGFEFVFSLFGLLLGLSLAEILGGFAKAVKRHGRHKLGVLTPMLSLFLLYDITTFWITAWRLREGLPVVMPALFTGLIVTGLYYFAAVLVWPEDPSIGSDREPSAWDDLDGWMLEHKRQVMLSVIASNLLSVAGVAYMTPGSFAWRPVDLTVLALYFGFMLATAFVRGKRATAAMLGVLIVLYGLDLFLNVSGG